MQIGLPDTIGQKHSSEVRYLQLPGLYYTMSSHMLNKLSIGLIIHNQWKNDKLRTLTHDRAQKSDQSKRACKLMQQ